MTDDIKCPSFRNYQILVEWKDGYPKEFIAFNRKDAEWLFEMVKDYTKKEKYTVILKGWPLGARGRNAHWITIKTTEEL